MSILEKQRGKIFGSILFAIAVYAVLLVASDFNKLVAELSVFNWALVPVILFFSLFNYALRFVKWHYYLHLVGVRNLHWFDSLLIFLSGFSMTITPGKAGEWVKSFLVKQVTGTPVATTAPIILAERMTDGLAMLLLAGAGLFLFDNPFVRWFMLAVVIAAVAATVLVQNRKLASIVGARMRNVPFLASRIDSLRAFYNASYEMLRFKNLVLAVLIGFVSWSGECFALFLILEGLGMEPSLPLLVLSAFAMGTATLVGSVVLLPGGLGATEGSIAGLLEFFGRAPWVPGPEITRDVAAGATLLIRFATLWFGVAIGFVALFIAQRRFGQVAEPMPADEAAIEAVS